jgi:hypothetical protein
MPIRVHVDPGLERWHELGKGWWQWRSEPGRVDASRMRVRERRHRCASPNACWSIQYRGRSTPAIEGNGLGGDCVRHEQVSCAQAPCLTRKALSINTIEAIGAIGAIGAICCAPRLP